MSLDSALVPQCPSSLRCKVQSGKVVDSPKDALSTNRLSRIGLIDVPGNIIGFTDMVMRGRGCSAQHLFRQFRGHFGKVDRKRP